MRKATLTPQTKAALWAIFVAKYGAYSWMSKRRRNIMTIAMGIYVIVPANLVFKVAAGQEISKAYAWSFLALFLIAFLMHQFFLSMELYAKKEYEDEMGAAAQVQKTLLPSGLPEGNGVTFASYFESSRDVGGDYYDVIPLDDDRYALVVVDVSGKGVPASLLMATLRALLRDFLRRNIKLTEVALQLNEALSQDTTPEQYATMFCGILDIRQKTLDYFNAGHVTPYIVSTSGDLRKLETGGPPVGMLSFSQYEQETQTIAPGDRLIAYTDGISDVAGPDGTSFTPEELEQFLADHRKESPDDLIQSVLARVKELSSGGDFDDDVTMLVAEVG